MLVWLVFLLALAAAQIPRPACTCSGYINQRGQGECRTAWKVTTPP